MLWSKPIRRTRPVKPRRRAVLQVEELESRRTPATLVNASTVTYQDVDGDAVTIKLTLPLFTPTNVANVLQFTPTGVNGDNSTPQQLRVVNLPQIGAAAEGVGVSITAVRGSSGDGLVNVGLLDGTGLDLAAVVVDGDLGQIKAGDSNTATPAMTSLKVQSLGRFGTTTGATNLLSTIKGTLGKLRVKGDIDQAFFSVTLGGSIGSVIVGGSLIGGAGNDSGEIQAVGNIGPVRIGGDLAGGAGGESGAIHSFGSFTGGLLNGVFVGVSVGGSLRGGANNSGSIIAVGDIVAVQISGDVIAGEISSDSGRIASLTIGGSLFGGTLTSSGSVEADSMGTVQIGGDVRAGTAAATGLIETDVGDIDSLRIGGSLIGGAQSSSGEIECQRDLPSVHIGRDIVGGDGSDSGRLRCFGSAAKITVGGSVISGTGLRSGAIQAGKALGTVVIKGSLVGNAAQPAIISASRQVSPTTADVAIASVSIGGRVEFGQILAGYSVILGTDTADAQIGTVTVGHDWIAGSIAAGVKDVNGDGFGNTDDALITGGDPNLHSKIGHIVIGGEVMGTTAAGDHVGFTAEAVGSLSIAGTVIALQAGPDNDNVVLGATNLTAGDFTLREV